ncbi:MAG: amidase, partial [Vulcanimicrobiaceae bacterium]
PGSSSGGSAAAVAGCFCPLALGSDTGGSIRQPASFCGIVGVKPTYGRISRYGVLPLSWSLDHVGPMTRTVSDAAIALGVLAGHDKLDGASRRVKVPDYAAALSRDLTGIRIGVLEVHFSSPVAPAVSVAVSTALEALRSNGASLRPIELKNVKHTSAAYFAISSAEALSAHEHFMKEHYHDYGDDFRIRLLQGVPILATQYLRAQKMRTLIKNEVARVLKDVDVLVSPTLPLPAPQFGQETETINGEAVNLRQIMSRFTAPFNLSGNPAISIPCGFDEEQLPIGLQLVGRAFDEETVLRVAYAYEQTVGTSLVSSGGQS